MIGELQAPGAAPAYRKGLLKALEMHLGLRGDPKLAVLASYELWQMHHAESPDSEAEFWALFQYGNHCLANRIFDNAATALTGARDLALRIGKPELAANCSRSLATALLAAGDPEESLKTLAGGGRVPPRRERPAFPWLRPAFPRGDPAAVEPLRGGAEVARRGRDLRQDGF